MRQLTQSEYFELQTLYQEVLEAEEQILPIGRHYALIMLLRRFGIIEYDKYKAKKVAQELLDNGYSKKFYLSRRDPMTAGVFMGLETAFRRVQDVNKQGVETVYKQNYTQPRYTQTAQPSYQEVIRQFPRERKERE